MKQENHQLVALNEILEATPVAAVCCELETGQIIYINTTFTTLFEESLETYSSVYDWLKSKLKQGVFQQNIKPLREQRTASELSLCLSTDLGNRLQVKLSYEVLADKEIWYFRNITEYGITERRLNARSEMLEMVAKSSALEDILEILVRQVQYEMPESICSVLLYDKDAKALMLGAAPDLPHEYNSAIDGVKIGMNVGSCGTAAFLQERVIVEDIFSHPYWIKYRDLARMAEVSACWSDPILSSKGELLGTFAIYLRKPSRPSYKDLKVINFASNLASIVVESFLAQEELEKRAYFDHLTGLINRGYFFEQCESILDSSTGAADSVSLVMMDVDHFKSVNDLYGHKTGDLVLQTLAQNGSSIFSNEDVFARIGGEEFVVLMPNVSPLQAENKAEALRKIMEKSWVLSAEKQKVFVTVSIGVAHKTEGYCSVDELLSCADKALYQSKASGRNCVTAQYSSSLPILL
ncbi:sensor domain-containing diguanylate cyclase [Marinomonas sp. THO17]|uniref:GGDEF domain-containing protein n=1 Tax=Marinomonas sp. THO17 TaxID=3149048 RepID=UPI00336BBD61